MLPLAQPSTVQQDVASDVNSVFQYPTTGWMQSQPHQTDSSQIAVDFILGCVHILVRQQIRLFAGP